MGLLDKLRHKDKDAIEYKRAQRLATTANENQNPGTEEYMELANRAGLFLNDPVATGLLLDNKNDYTGLLSLVPILSPTNSVINLSKHEADLKRLRWENHITLLKLTMPPKVYNANGLEVLEGYRMYGHDRISGAENGWLGHIATEITKVHEFRERKIKD